jgi:hypothetical protein
MPFMAGWVTPVLEGGRAATLTSGELQAILREARAILDNRIKFLARHVHLGLAGSLAVHVIEEMGEIRRPEDPRRLAELFEFVDGSIADAAGSAPGADAVRIRQSLSGAEAGAYAAQDALHAARIRATIHGEAGPASGDER